MTPADAARLLGIAAIYDKRTIGKVEAQAWADALSGLEPRQCADAIRQHYTETTAYLMPAHVRDKVLQIRRDRKRVELDGRTFAAIEAAKAKYSRDEARAGYLEATRLLQERLAEIHAADEPEAQAS